MKIKLSPRASLIIIALMFLLPLLAAWFMYSGTIAYKPAATRNHGTLVEPPLPLKWQDAVVSTEPGQDGQSSMELFSSHWVILYPVPDDCPQSCQQVVTALRQIHRAAGRHQARLRLALLLERDDPDLESRLRGMYSTFNLVLDPSGGIVSALEQTAGGPGAVYLIDPLANIMMTYEAGADPNHIKQDLKRLLTWSKLDEQQ